MVVAAPRTAEAAALPGVHLPDSARRVSWAALRRRLTESVAAIREVVGHQPLRQAELAYALACTAEWAFTVALGVVAYRDAGAAAVGLVALARMVPSAMASPFLTVFADRTRRERVLAAVSALRAVAIGVAAVVLAAGSSGFAVYALAVAATVAFTVFRPAHSALLPSLCTTTRQLTSANVVRGFVDSSSAFIGPALAGLLLAASGPSAVFAATAALSLAAAVVLLRIRYEVPLRMIATRRAALVRDTLDGLRAVTGHPDLVLVCGLGFAQTAVRGALNVLTVVVALELLDSGDAGVAALSAAIGVGGIVGSLGTSFLVGSRHLGRWLAVALVLWGAPIALIGIAPGGATAFVLLAVVGLGNAIIDVPFFTLPVRLADDALLARVFGVFESLVALGVGLGAILTPPLITYLDLRGALIAIGLLLPLLAGLCWRRLAGLDRRIGVRDDEIAILRDTPMLGQLPVPSIEHLANRMRRRSVPAGTVVFAQGDPGHDYYVIVDGEAEVVGDGRFIRTLAAGESFGEIALIRDVPRTATVRARGALEVFELDRDAFLDAIGGSSESQATAFAVVAKNLANFNPVAIGP
jgi:MFS family permease